MAGGFSPGAALANSNNKTKNAALALLVVVYFIIGFITVLNDILIPSMKELFNLKASEAMLIQFAFFIGYGIWSIPAGILIQKIGYKKGLIFALLLTCMGLFLFVPAASIIKYGFFLFVLFIVASGLTFVQVALNPLIVAIGPERTGSSRMNLGGAFNSFATAIGPIVGGAFILGSLNINPADFADEVALNEATSAARAEAVQGPYILLALIIAGIAAALYYIDLPEIHSDANQTSDTSKQESIFDYKHLLFGAGGIFCYVGVEVAIGSILMLYLATPEMGSLGHDKAVPLLAYYWGSAMIGRIIGFIVCQKIPPQYLLLTVTIAALGFVLFSFTPFALNNMVEIPLIVGSESSATVPIAALCLILCGLCHSVMWPSIFPLSISGLEGLTAKASGLLCTMIIGGAFIPLGQGLLADIIGYKLSFIICVACYAYILFFAISGYKAGKIGTLIYAQNSTKNRGDLVNNSV